jgi:hypothetical protein
VLDGADAALVTDRIKAVLSQSLVRA